MIEDVFASMRSISDLLEERINQKLSLTIQIGIINRDIAKCQRLLLRLEGGRPEKPCRVCGNSFLPRSDRSKTCATCVSKARCASAMRMNELRAARSVGPRAVPFKKAVGE